MVQEFHVLRCFSCQAFQVQQVKKSKKWACKVCGEKQSLMKEFGRGAAADCRRHVQKLNALRGRLQEVSSERLVSQWEQDDEYENEDVQEGLDQNQMDKSEHVSRWSKYTDSSAEGPNEHEDEGEEQNVYTERHRFRSQGTRKRKKISTLKSFAGPNDGCEDESSWTGCSGFKRPFLHKRFSSAGNKGFDSCGRSDDVDPCSSTNLPSSRQAVCSYPTACSSSTYTEENSGNKQQCNSSHKPPAVDVTRRSESPSVSSSQKFGGTKIMKDSKWSKFLTVVPSQQDEEEYDYQAHYNDNTAMPYSTEALADVVVDWEEHRYSPDEKVNGGVCVNGNVSNSHTSRTSGFENPVCEQPPPAKTPCSKLSFNSLFLTDEDFDDTF